MLICSPRGKTRAKWMAIFRPFQLTVSDKEKNDICEVGTRLSKEMEKSVPSFRSYHVPELCGGGGGETHTHPATPPHIPPPRLISAFLHLIS